MRPVHKEDPGVWDGNVIGGCNADLAGSEGDEKDKREPERSMYMLGDSRDPRLWNLGTTIQSDGQMGR